LPFVNNQLSKGNTGNTKPTRKEAQIMKTLLAFLGVVLVAGSTIAATKPIQFSLTPDIALYDRTTTIAGLTLNIWGENPQTALALGFVNGSTGQSAGLSLAVILNYANNYKGLQWGLVNCTKGDFLGWQGGVLFGLAGSLVNYTGGTMKGLQTGVVNYAGRLTGLQFGVVNYAAAAQTGVQIGVVNLMPENRWFTGLPDELAPGMILVNWRF
jgi:hypothetical protein